MPVYTVVFSALCTQKMIEKKSIVCSNTYHNGVKGLLKVAKSLKVFSICSHPEKLKSQIFTSGLKVGGGSFKNETKAKMPSAILATYTEF